MQPSEHSDSTKDPTFGFRAWHLFRPRFFLGRVEVEHRKCYVAAGAGAITGLFAGAGAGVGVGSAVPIKNGVVHLVLVLSLAVAGAVLGFVGGAFGGPQLAGCYEAPSGASGRPGEGRSP